MPKKIKLEFSCKECKAKNDISNAPDFSQGGFKCHNCGIDNDVMKNELLKEEKAD